MCSKCSRELQAAAERGTAACKTFDSFAPASCAEASPVQQCNPLAALADTAAGSVPALEFSAPVSVAQPTPAAVWQDMSVAEVIASPTQAQPFVVTDDPADDRPVQKNTSRCFSCKKKVHIQTNTREHTHIHTAIAGHIANGICCSVL